MKKASKPRSFDEVVALLQERQFDVTAAPGVPGLGVASESGGRLRVSKYGAAAEIIKTNNLLHIVAKPGLLLGGEVAHLLDRGYQKFFKTSRLELPATADQLRAVHRMHEELREAIGSDSLYNEALGTVSDKYVYDRIKGRRDDGVPA